MVIFSCSCGIVSGPSIVGHVAAFYDWLAEEHPEVKRIVVVALDDPLMVAFADAFVGINCLLMWPTAILEVVGEREYQLLEYYTPEQAEAIAAEAWTATMP